MGTTRSAAVARYDGRRARYALQSANLRRAFDFALRLRGWHRANISKMVRSRPLMEAVPIKSRDRL